MHCKFRIIPRFFEDSSPHSSNGIWQYNLTIQAALFIEILEEFWSKYLWDWKAKVFSIAPKDRLFRNWSWELRSNDLDFSSVFSRKARKCEMTSNEERIWYSQLNQRKKCMVRSRDRYRNHSFRLLIVYTQNRIDLQFPLIETVLSEKL
jgi:hypothetical protein